MTKKNILKLRKRTTKFNSYSDVVSAMTEADVAEGEVIVGYYEEDGEDHAVLGLGGPGGEMQYYFTDGKSGGGGDVNPEIAKIKEAIGYYEEEVIDLGLPSGTLWSKTNLGAKTETDFGLFYSWGDTEGYVGDTGHNFSWDTYKWGAYDNLSKYNSSDGKLVLENEDDPVWVATGGKMKSPTKEQLQELRDHTNREWTSIDGVYGMKFINKSDDTKYIFIPAAGGCYDSDHYDVGSWGSVWSSSRSSGYPSSAWYMTFDSGGVYMYGNTRCSGYSVRGVAQTQVVNPKSTKLDPVDDAMQGHIPVLTQEGTLKDSGTISVKDGELVQTKDDKLYPVSHPDLSTQPSILPQRFGNMDIKEVLIPIETPTSAQTIDIESLPLNVMPLTSSVFCNILQSNATLKKGSDAWELSELSGSESSWDSADWWLLVQYVEQDNGFYYGPQYDEIDDTDDGEAVDLGLPSGTLWQKSNLGGSKPSDFGLFYQWADTQGYAGVDEKTFNWDNYKYGTSWDNMTKYNNSDGKLVLDNDDDPVYVASSGQYKSPTQEQLQELMDNTDHQWIRLANGVNGMKFINKNDDTKYIFIPAAGSCYGSSHSGVGSWGYVWSSSRNSGKPNGAWDMYFNSGDVSMYGLDRCSGYSVRGVVAKDI